jgi:ankyrin repeat protein
MLEDESNTLGCDQYRILINTVWQNKSVCNAYCQQLIMDSFLPEDAPRIDDVPIVLYALKLAFVQDHIPTEYIPNFILQYASSKLITQMIEEPVKDGAGPLHLAAALGMNYLVKSLVTGKWPYGMKQNSVPVDTCYTNDGCTAAMIAINERNQDTAELLLSLGANPRACHKGNSLLALSCVRGCDRIARKLIEEYHVPVNDVDQEKGNTLLHDLFLGDRYDDSSQESILKLLLQHNVPQTPNNMGLTPLDHAVWQGSKKGIEALASVSCTESPQAYEQLCNDTRDHWVAYLRLDCDQACDIKNATASLCTNEDILKKLFAQHSDKESRDIFCMAAGMGGNIVAARLLLEKLSLQIMEERDVYRSNCLTILKSAIKRDQGKFIRAMKALMPKYFTSNDDKSLLNAALMQDDFKLAEDLAAYRLCQTTHVRCITKEGASEAIEAAYLDTACDDGGIARYALIFADKELTMMRILSADDQE